MGTSSVSLQYKDLVNHMFPFLPVLLDLRVLSLYWGQEFFHSGFLLHRGCIIDVHKTVNSTTCLLGIAQHFIAPSAIWPPYPPNHGAFPCFQFPSRRKLQFYHLLLPLLGHGQIHYPYLIILCFSIPVYPTFMSYSHVSQLNMI